MFRFNKFSNLGHNLFKGVLDCLFPQNCIFCEGFRGNGGDFLCGMCRNDICRIEPPYCHNCGASLEISYSIPARMYECGVCRKTPYSFDRARSLGPYTTVLKQLIHHFKYEKQKGVMSEILPLLERYFSEAEENWEGLYVSPVPLHFKRMKKRTFDQAFLIAKGVAEVLGLPLANGMIRRVRETESQAKKNKAERQQNIKGAFQVDRPELVEGKDILLVDDVFTTGATTNEASRVLKKAGAGQVVVFTLARVGIE